MYGVNSTDSIDEESVNQLFLTFNLGDEKYAIDILYIKEITGMQEITKVPNMPSFARGVINLRGLVIPVIDMRTRFNMTPKDYDDRTCAIVVDFDESRIGLIVDAVDEVIDIPEENVSLPNAISSSAAGEFVKGLGRTLDTVIIILDVEKLLGKHEIESLAQVGGKL